MSDEQKDIVNNFIYQAGKIVSVGKVLVVAIVLGTTCVLNYIHKVASSFDRVNSSIVRIEEKTSILEKNIYNHQTTLNAHELNMKEMTTELRYINKSLTK